MALNHAPRRTRSVTRRLLGSGNSAPAAGLFLAPVLALTGPADAQTWLGPGDFCSSDTLLGDWRGSRARLAKLGIGFGLQEQTELWGNLTGGLKPGVAYDGLTLAGLCVDLDKAARWKGATVFASGFQVWGPGPTRELVGALQLISGLEATPSTKLYDLWFEQQFFDGKVSLRFGQEGANDEMMLADYAALYLNSSFGFPPLLALDLPSGGPNYPLAAPFVRVRLNPSNQLTLIGAVYTEDPAPEGDGDPQLRDRHGTAFRLNDHALSFAEVWYQPQFMAEMKLPGTYRIGVWYATGLFDDPVHDTGGFPLASAASTQRPQMHSGNYGVYAIFNQMLWHKPGTEAEGIGLFLELMHAPADRNISDWFIAGGLNWKGPLPQRTEDEAGLAVTYAGLGAAERHFGQDVVFFTGSGSPFAQGEAIIEATYRARLTSWLNLQPDVQFVINPGAGIPTPQAPNPLKNALVAGVRLTVNF